MAYRWLIVTTVLFMYGCTTPLIVQMSGECTEIRGSSDAKSVYLQSDKIDLRKWHHHDYGPRERETAQKLVVPPELNDAGIGSIIVMRSDQKSNYLFECSDDGTDLRSCAIITPALGESGLGLLIVARIDLQEDDILLLTQQYWESISMCAS